PGAKSPSRSRQFSATASGSSPPSRARLSESYGTPLTPSRRSVNATATGPRMSRKWYKRLLQEVGDVQVVVVELHRARGRLGGGGRGGGRRGGRLLRLLLLRGLRSPGTGLVALGGDGGRGRAGLL